MTIIVMMIREDHKFQKMLKIAWRLVINNLRNISAIHRTLFPPPLFSKKILMQIYKNINKSRSTSAQSLQISLILHGYDSIRGASSSVY